MRIALVAPLVTPIAEPQRGGSQALLCDLAAALAHRGHEVTVFAANGSRIPGVDVRQVVDAADLSDTLYRADRQGSVSPAAEEAFRRVAQMVAAGGFDVVHNHAFDVAAVRALAGLAPPVVHTVHLPPTPGMVEALREVVRHVGSSVSIITVSRAQERAWRSAVPNRSGGW